MRGPNSFAVGCRSACLNIKFQRMIELWQEGVSFTECRGVLFGERLCVYRKRSMETWNCLRQIRCHHPPFFSTAGIKEERRPVVLRYLSLIISKKRTANWSSSFGKTCKSPNIGQFFSCFSSFMLGKRISALWWWKIENQWDGGHK